MKQSQFNKYYFYISNLKYLYIYGMRSHIIWLTLYIYKYKYYMHKYLQLIIWYSRKFHFKSYHYSSAEIVGFVETVSEIEYWYFKRFSVVNVYSNSLQLTLYFALYHIDIFFMNVRKLYAVSDTCVIFSL